MNNSVNTLVAEQKWEEAGRQLERILRGEPLQLHKYELELELILYFEQNVLTRQS